jgi:hypothetical protein
VQADLKACAGAESGGGGCESAGAKRGGEMGEGQEGQVRQAMPEEGGEGVFRSKPGVMAADYWGDFPICHWTSWAFLGTQFVWVGYSLSW